MGDVDDPDIYVAEPIMRWRQTNVGAWALENAQELSYNICPDPSTFGYRVDIVGKIDDPRIITEYYLRFGHND